MSIELITLLLFTALIVTLALGLPLVFTLAGIAIVFSLLLWGPKSLYIIPSVTTSMVFKIMLIAIPLFVFMASVLERAGIAEELYNMMHHWFGPIRGGLAAGTVVICTIFAAMSGVTAAGTVTMGIVALPNMLKRGYDKKIAIGCIMAGGALGQLIPPSVILIIYGMLAEQSVGRLFLGGVIPGLILSTLFITYILVRSFFNPSLGPPLPPEECADWGQKFASLRAVILPAMLVVGVLGSIFAGVATPTEAAAVGALGSLICAGIHRKLSWQLVRDACLRTIRVTAMIVWIMMAAKMFVTVYQGIGAPHLVQHALAGIPGGKWMILAAMQLSFFVLGCFMDPTGIIMITGPVYLPLANSLGFDPIWFGILFAVNIEMGYLTPPFGTNLFYMKGIAPKGITMADIYRSIVPFVGLQAIGLLLVIFFPPLALWLPNMVFNR